MEKLLPIGTIVSIAEGTIDVEIVGYGGVGKDGIYDYIGLIYPYGFIGQDKILTFTKEKIVKILHQGYEDENFPKFIENVSKAIEQAREAK